MRIRRSLPLALAAALALPLAACSGATAPTPMPTASPPPVASGCIADPAALAGTPFPDSSRMPVGAELAAAYREAALTGLAESSAPGLAIAVVSPEGTWTEAFGSRAFGSDEPMTLDEHVRIGSVTKTFTGTIVLQLQDEGALSLDDPVSKYFDGVPEGDAVTLRMLITMTSGIASYTLDDGFQATYFGDPTHQWDPDELIAMAIALPRTFAPGAGFEYSNTNTIMLGRIVEQVTGRPFAEVLGERILKPLGLSQTSFPSDSAMPAPFAAGITLQGADDPASGPLDATLWSPSYGWTAGQMISTVPDLVVYGEALVTGVGLLDPATQLERLTFPAGGGYGEAIGCVGGWVGHTGELPGYNTAVFYDTLSGTLVVAAVNSDIPSGACPVSATLPDQDPALPCMDPVVRVLQAVSRVIGNEYWPPSPMQ